MALHEVGARPERAPGERGDQQLALGGGRVAGQHVERVVRGGPHLRDRVSRAGEGVAVALIVVVEGGTEGRVAEVGQPLVAGAERQVERVAGVRHERPVRIVRQPREPGDRGDVGPDRVVGHPVDVVPDERLDRVDELVVHVERARDVEHQLELGRSTTPSRAGAFHPRSRR